MHLRIFTAFAVLLFAAAPLLAEPPKPTITLQAKPVSRLMGDAREIIRQVAGPDFADKVLKEFDNGLKEVLGEQGFEGLDVNRPLGGYVVLRDEIQDTSAVFVIPITGEKEFIGLLGRMKLQTEAVKDKPGVYTLQFPEAIFPKASVVHVAGAWAHVSLNVGDAVDAKDLIPAETLIDNTDQALFTARLYPDRIPEKLAKTALDQMDQLAGMVKGFVGGAGAPPNWARLATTFFEDGPKLVRRYVETGRKEAAELALRFTWDPAAADTVTEFALTPKAGTQLAKDIAATTVENRFAGVIPKDAVVGAVFKAPLFAEEIRNIVAALLEAGQAELKNEEHKIPQNYHPIIDEVAKSLIGSVKKGQLDGAVAVAGPTKDGKFTIIGGFSLDNAPAVEKAARELVKGRDFAKVVQLDVEKAGTVSIHKVDLMTLFPEGDRRQFAKLVGENAPGYAAFASDAVFAAVGPDALNRIKAALAAKPGPGPYLDVLGNMKRLHAMIVAIEGERDADMFAKMVGTDDKLASMVRISAEGGQKLSVKLVISRYLPKMMMVGRAAEVRPVQPAPVIK
jgi:hypothetical protein